jgi:hypothetical protein
VYATAKGLPHSGPSRLSDVVSLADHPRRVLRAGRVLREVGVVSTEVTSSSERSLIAPGSESAQDETDRKNETRGRKRRAGSSQSMHASRRSVLALGSTLALTIVLTLAACGGSGDGESKTSNREQRATTPTTQNPATFDGPWTGTTSQGKPISFTVTDGHMSAFSISFALTGPDCNITDFTTNSTRDPQIAITDGQFSLPPAGSPLFEGRFNSPTEASGTGHTEAPPEKTPGCVAVDITWEAHR